MTQENSCEIRTPAEMAKIAEKIAVYKVERTPLKTFYLSIVAGGFIALGFIFAITVSTGAEGAPYGFVKLAAGLCFALGLMTIVVCGGDLFTSTVLTVIAVAAKRVSYKQMFFNWTNVYVGNFVGCLLIALMLYLAGQHMAAKGLWGLNLLQMANYKLHRTFVEAVFQGIFANLMVCLAIWMSYAGRSLIDKAMIVLLPVAMFVAAGFEHCVANMFLIPLAIWVQSGAEPAFWQAIGFTAEQFSSLTFEHFIIKNLIPVTIGNAIGGGILVGLVQWYLHIEKPKPVEEKSLNQQNERLVSEKSL